MLSNLLPMFMFETETGNIKLLYDEQDVRIIVEEFWDILEMDFKFWDKDGYPLLFDESFSKKGLGCIQRGAKANYEEVWTHLMNYAREKGVEIQGYENLSLVDLFLKVERKTDTP